LRNNNTYNYNNNNHYRVKLNYPDNQISEFLNIYFLNKKKLNKIPQYENPCIFIIYLNNDNYGGKVGVVVETNDRVYWGGFLESYWNEKPKCDENSNVLKLYLPKGKYKFYAENKTSIWRNEINVSHDCSSMALN
jgi:hypothetical protein